MLTAYINAALRKAHYEILPDGEGYFGSIEGLQGVWAQAETLEACREELVTPQALLDAGWDRLVSVLDRGHYVRFDFSTATKLLDIAQSLTTRYGSLTNLLRQSGSGKDLALRLQEFKGIGPVTTRIFLRDIKSHSR